MKEIQNRKVKDAVNSIIQNHAFYATIILQQEIIEDNSDKNPTFYVDGKHLAYNDDFANSLTFDEIKGVLCHEVMHLTLLHHSRMGKRDSKLWNKAADFSINQELIKDGFKLPKGVLLDCKYDGMNAEDIYRSLLLEQMKEESKKEGEGKESGGKQGESKGGESGEKESKEITFGEVRPSIEENAEETAKIQSKQAISIAKSCGEMPSSKIIDMINSTFVPKFDWQQVINQFISEVTNKDYSFERPDNRFIHNGIILPDLYSESPTNIVIAIDTSGSVNIEEVKAIVEEAKSCLDIMAENKDNASLTVIYCDAQINGVELFESGSEIKPNPKGGGGTNFSPVFKHIEENDIECNALIYITDGYCWSFGDIIPSYPVLWGLTCENKMFKPPFGETFKFELF